MEPSPSVTAIRVLLYRSQRNNSATKPEEIKLNDAVDAVIRTQLSDTSKPVYRRHTVCGVVGLISSEFKVDEDLPAADGGIFDKRSMISGEYSFAKNVSKDDWKMKLRLRSSSPDLICFNDFKFSLAQEGCPLSFISSLLESQV